MPGRVLFVGNFGVPWTTEWELRRAFEAHGWEVDPASERDVAYLKASRIEAADLMLYVATQGVSPGDAEGLYRACKAHGVTTACFHLDLLYGLTTPKGAAGIPRDEWPARHPQFRADWAFTADGSHQAEFERDGVRHVWLPPGVSEFECVPGTPRAEYSADVSFVGSWKGYHPESTHRRDLIAFLRSTYGDRLKLWPDPKGGPAIRREELRDLYASTRVVVGDSCMYGQRPIPRYCSDRIPETLGRGGFLLHPYTKGVVGSPGSGALWENGIHLGAWRAGDWEELARAIDYYLANPRERELVAAQGRVHTLVRHTYTHRVAAMLRAMGLWDGPSWA